MFDSCTCIMCGSRVPYILDVTTLQLSVLFKGQSDSTVISTSNEACRQYDSLQWSCVSVLGLEDRCFAKKKPQALQPFTSRQQYGGVPAVRHFMYILPITQALSVTISIHLKSKAIVFLKDLTKDI